MDVTDSKEYRTQPTHSYPAHTIMGVFGGVKYKYGSGQVPNYQAGYAQHKNHTPLPFAFFAPLGNLNMVK